MQQPYRSFGNIGLEAPELPRKYVPYNQIHSVQETQEQDNEIGYDDILNALNVRLHQGKLHALSREEKRANMRAATIAAAPSKSPSYLPRGGQPRMPRVPVRNGLASKQYAPPPPPAPLQKVNPHLQNNYIYNKYFKEYARQESAPPRPSRPLTREEYIAQMRKKAFEEARQIQRIRQIKSKKLFFNNGDNTNIHVQARTYHHGYGGHGGYGVHGVHGGPNRVFRLKGV